MSAADATAALLNLIRHLRAPDGCPWDREQTHESLRPYVVEEAHEVAEALDSGETHRLREELGDLLLQIVLHAVIAEESGHFTWDDIVSGLTDKLVRRHPHVFGEAEASTPAEVTVLWQAVKAEERDGQAASALDGIPGGLPALQRAWQIGRRAARAGFDWDDVSGVWEALDAELAELRAEVDAGNEAGADDEFGDVLFTLCNLARFIGVEPEGSLGRATEKFNRRYRALEQEIADQGVSMKDLSMGELEALWQEAKARTRTGGMNNEQR